ncbi:MAG TPA: hypothetical protein VGC20_18350 [bacterium]|jgi:hypothetical protein
MENLYPLLFGLIGTGLMSLVLALVSQSGGAAAQVKGIGSSIPTPVGGSQVPGAAVHIVGGIVFGYVYLGLGHSMGALVPASLLALGAGVGIVRGIAVSAVLGMLAFDQRPLERIQLAGAGVGTAHVLGNVLYGLVLSALYGLTRVDYLLSF